MFSSAVRHQTRAWQHDSAIMAFYACIKLEGLRSGFSTRGRPSRPGGELGDARHGFAAQNFAVLGYKPENEVNVPELTPRLVIDFRPDAESLKHAEHDRFR